jgi:hypothetical protein
MSDAQEKRKDLWDKLASITPLVLGIAVTGMGALFTQVYNYRQLQLNQITALDKLRPLLTSDKPEEREFGYASFAALGYEEVAVRIIQIKKDQSGRTVLVELQKSSGNPQLQANATDALKSLDEAKSLVNKLEYGDTRGLDAWMERGEKLAAELGLKTKLARALIAAEVINGGMSRTKRLSDATTKQLGGNPASGADEKAWVAKYLDVMQEQRGSVPQAFIQRRIQEFRLLVDKGDWELTTYKPAPPNPSLQGTPASGRP